MKINIVENQDLPNGEKGSVGYVNNTDDVFYLIPPVKTMNTLNYVYSMWVKADEDREIKVTQGCVEQVSAKVKANEWTRVVLKFTADGKEVFIELAPGIYYLYQAQLEQGTIASDWDRKTTDVIDETKSEITQLADSVSVAVKELSEGIEKNSAEILVQKGQIELKVSEGDVSSSLSLEEGDIRLVGNRIAIDSDFFKLTNDGEIEATAGKLGCFTVDKNKVSIKFDGLKAYPIDEFGRHFFGSNIFYDDEYSIIRMYEHDLFKNCYYFGYFEEKSDIPWAWDTPDMGEDITVMFDDATSYIWKITINGKQYHMANTLTNEGYYVQYGYEVVNNNVAPVLYISTDTEITQRKYYMISDRLVNIGDNPYPTSLEPQVQSIREYTLNTDKNGNGDNLITYGFLTPPIPNPFKSSVGYQTKEMSKTINEVEQRKLELLDISSNQVKIGAGHYRILSIPYENDFAGYLDIYANYVGTDLLGVEEDILLENINPEEERICEDSQYVPSGHEVWKALQKLQEQIDALK